MNAPARGHPEGDKLKVACSFDTRLFLRIRKRAEKEKRSFTSMVEELCKVGLLDLEESDRLEPHKEHPHVASHP
jgi:hypothetical protein